MRAFKTEAIVIKRRNFWDSDRIVTVLTKDYGKIHVRAAGVRKITSRRSPHIELLNYSMLSLYKGNSFPILTEAQTINDFSAIKTDLTKVGHAYHVCELIDSLCAQDQEQRQVFFLLKNTLTRLGIQDLVSLQMKENGLSIIHEFELELLSLLGYWNRATEFSQLFDADQFIEGIIERKLKSKNIFAKLT